jgi:hypothetical protein
MLKFLLDEQISSRVAEGLRQRNERVVVHCLTEWQDGRFLGLGDDVLLRHASAECLTLVTYDRKTIPPLLKAWAEEGSNHAGVVFVDDKTIPSSDFGGLIRALLKLWDEAARWNWTNRIVVMRR